MITEFNFHITWGIAQTLSSQPYGGFFVIFLNSNSKEDTTRWCCTDYNMRPPTTSCELHSAHQKSPTEFSQVGRPLHQTQNCKTGTNRILNQISLMHKLHGTYIGYTHEVPKSKNKLNQTGSTCSNCSQG